MATKSSQSRQRRPRQPAKKKFEFEPVVLTSKTDEEREEEELITLFTIDGTEYQVPARPRATIAMKTLREVRDYGEEIALLGFLEEILTEEGYEALMNFQDLQPEQMSKIFDGATKLALGAVEVPKGSRRG